MKGEEAAFNELYNRYWPGTYAHAISILKDSSLAQEVSQDIFLKIWELRADLSAARNFRNYLFIIARNRILSELRKKVSAMSRSSWSPDEEFSFPPDRQLHYKELYGRILDTIEKLPPQKKMVFKMSRIEQLSRAEIVQQTGLSYGTVNQYLVEALVFLRTHLGKYISAGIILLGTVIYHLLKK